MSQSSLNVKQILLAAVACFLWSTAFVGVKYGLRFVGPFQFAGLRFMLSGLLILPFCGPPAVWMKEMRRHGRVILKVALFQTFLLYGFFFIGMTLLPGALAAIVIGASPLTSALVAHAALPDDQLTWRKWLSIGLAVVGIVLITLYRDPFVTSSRVQLLGIALLTAGCVMSAIGNVIVSKARQLRAFTLSAGQLFAGGLMLFVLSLFFEPLPSGPLPGLFYLTFFYLSVMSSAAFSLWFYLLKQPGVKVSELNLWKFVIPVFGAVLSWILLPGEQPNKISLIGMLCVSSAVLFYFTSKSGRH